MEKKKKEVERVPARIAALLATGQHRQAWGGGEEKKNDKERGEKED